MASALTGEASDRLDEVEPKLSGVKGSEGGTVKCIDCDRHRCVAFFETVNATQREEGRGS